MNCFKKQLSFLALSLILATQTSHSMQWRPSSGYMSAGTIALIGGILIGKYALSVLWQEPFPFNEILPEIQNLILASVTGDTLEEEGKAINTLAQVNKELNTLINSPQYFFQLINHLAEKFNATEFSVCAALQTFAAKQYLFVNIEDVQMPFVKTPLMEAIETLNMEKFLRCLDNPYLLTNKQNNQGETALLYALKQIQHSLAIGKSQEIIQTLRTFIGQLLLAGADPTIADNNGTTPLQIAEKLGMPGIVKKIKEIIAEKHGASF